MDTNHQHFKQKIMMAKKIKTEHWKPIIPAKELKTGYLVPGKAWKTTSEFAKSRGVAECGCCGSEMEIYIWSFAGGGKRCTTCGVVLGYSGGFIPIADMPSGIKYENGNLIKQ